MAIAVIEGRDRAVVGPGGFPFGGFGGHPAHGGAGAARPGAETSAPPRCCCSPRSRATATKSCRRSRSEARRVASSPGSVYPALQQLEDEGLIRSEEVDGRKLFRLTDEGPPRSRSATPSSPAPWEQMSGDVGDEAHELGKLMREVASAFVQVMRDWQRGAAGGGAQGARRRPSRPVPHPRRRVRARG